MECVEGHFEKTRKDKTRRWLVIGGWGGRLSCADVDDELKIIYCIRKCNRSINQSINLPALRYYHLE